MEYRYRLLDICCATNLITFSLVQLLALLKKSWGGKNRRTKKTKSPFEPGILWKRPDDILHCYVKTQWCRNVCSIKGCTSIRVSQFLSCLGSLLSSKSEAPDTAVYSWRMRWEPDFMYQKKSHNALNDAAQWQTAHNTRGRLQFEYGSRGGVLHKELGTFSPFFLCPVRHAEPLGHLDPFWLPHIHCYTAGR